MLFRSPEPNAEAVTEEPAEEAEEVTAEEKTVETEEVFEEKSSEEAVENVEEAVNETAEEETVEVTEEAVEEVSETEESPVKDEPVASSAEDVAEEEVKKETAATAVPAVEDDDEDDGEDDDVEDNETAEEKQARLAAIESAPELENNQRYNRSFKARLIQSSDTVKEWYSLVKDAALSYKGTRSSLSWRQEKIYKGRVLFAKIALRGKTLSIYFPLSVSNVKNIMVEDV